MSTMTMPFTKPHIEDRGRRVRVLFNGRFIVDTNKAKLVWESPYYPTYYFVKSDLDPSLLREFEKLQDAQVYDLVSGDRVAKGAVTEFTGNKELAGLFKVAFPAADAWFEEDEKIFVHPKDPYKRVDVLQSSRNVRVEIDGVEIAKTNKPRRTYMPLTDVRLDFLRPSETTTACPYKGVANYYNVVLPNGKIHKDVVWYYRAPLAECIQITGMAAFYDEKVDVWVDGEKQT
ncbi:hypothetical protein EDD16DRAFT_1546676 [Pisolithus croceorrhizus]|nr:hypothetical protein EDD16DRAFT_1546676 [Pisolithus croceorrhizus]